jgi:hypothetical protein
LQADINGEMEIVACHRLLCDDGTFLMAKRINLNALLSRPPTHLPVKGLFHSILAHDAPLMEVRKIRPFELIRRYFSDIPQQMRGDRAAGIIPLRFHLHHHTWQV